jgi:hypothetical protein
LAAVRSVEEVTLDARIGLDGGGDLVLAGFLEFGEIVHGGKPSDEFDDIEIAVNVLSRDPRKTRAKKLIQRCRVGGFLPCPG